ncbi:ATP-binding protein [Caldicellulosiruptor changbaiensis]|uniref:ATP-binding protein n=1 Tax=Caldicellulosiruptor changbaiensis TaxID=1222016 RepID=A0A3T0D7Y8_9FIRM|nr:ATP-binding protein [Caldicellulosiruptor changbaiensis]AZT91247.1 ATP-binding protein [Caldicellulosiruptor changbaiensis]
MEEKIRLYRLCFESLKVYRNLLHDSVLEKLYNLICYIDDGNQDFKKVINLYSTVYYNLLEASTGCSLKEYIIEKILFSENAFAKLSAKGINNIAVDESLKKAAAHDLDCLEFISNFSGKDIEKYLKILDNFPNFLVENFLVSESTNALSHTTLDNTVKNIIEKFLATSPWSSLIEELVEFHKQNGFGIFARYKGFSWDGNNLVGIENLDPIRLDDLVNIERQKRIVVENTLAFLNGQRVNNILLYGSRGTGKSSTVKALLNEFSHMGLRVVEVYKDQFYTFPKLIRILRDVPLRFIIFVDDLSFEDIKENYTKLKAILEGSLEAMPQNVVIYATSNRRHLVKERFSDRNGLSDDEVHFNDTLEEKLSLADRFGIVVTYPSPTQQEYLAIVDEIAKKRGIEITEKLHRLALQWEVNYNGRSARTAKQFVDWYEAQVKMEKG